MKHFFNRRETVVTEAIDGLLRTSGAGKLMRLDGYPDIKVVLRSDWDKSKVALVSGGGAGHEPSHAGFVGKGMLTAAVSGDIFASPSTEAVLAAIRAVTGPAGCLLIVKNYTGDRLNFGLAVERARSEGYAVEMVIVADDIALPDLPQPRGVAGTLFVHKIAGHLSENGSDLASIATAARAVARDTVSLGLSLSSCSIPGQEHEERLGAEEGELGLGIHGEPGVERIALESAAALVKRMADKLVSHLDASARYVALFNNLGAVPPLEMSLVANAVLDSQIGKHIALTIGPAPLMTALNMNGFSLSLLKLDADREAALSSGVAPDAWPSANPVAPIQLVVLPGNGASTDAIVASEDARAEKVIRSVCDKLIDIEHELNRLDAKTGDGDTGATVATGARSIVDRLSSLPLANHGATMAMIGSTLGSSMGGSSGVLLSIFFTSAGKSLDGGAALPDALLHGLERIKFYGGAKPGDRTMIDALEPALLALSKSGLRAAAAAAREGANATERMKSAKAGRSAYLGDGQLEGNVDPGALAVAEAFAALDQAG